MHDIVVVGSMNMDLVVRATRMPEPGETIAGTEFHLIPGGKGANQAVACARQGASTAMVGRVGCDAFGPELVQSLENSQVDVSNVRALEGRSTGTATILVNESGENRIIVVPGANACWQSADVVALEHLICNAKAVVMQFEIPMETILQVSAFARRCGVKVVINPAPVKNIPPELYANLDVLIVNEIEASLLTHVEVNTLDEAFAAGDVLLAKGVGAVCLTLGERGAILVTPRKRLHVPAIPVSVVDTTGAGDSFVGGFVASLVDGAGVETALRVAVCTGCLAVTRLGAQPSIPDKRQVLSVLPESEVIFFGQRGGVRSDHRLAKEETHTRAQCK